MCYVISYSSNLTVEDSPFKITTEVAKEVLEKTPELQEPQSIEPIGKLCK